MGSVKLETTKLQSRAYQLKQINARVYRLTERFAALEQQGIQLLVEDVPMLQLLEDSSSAMKQCANYLDNTADHFETLERMLQQGRVNPNALQRVPQAQPVVQSPEKDTVITTLQDSILFWRKLREELIKQGIHDLVKFDELFLDSLVADWDPNSSPRDKARKIADLITKSISDKTGHLKDIVDGLVDRGDLRTGFDGLDFLDTGLSVYDMLAGFGDMAKAAYNMEGWQPFLEGLDRAADGIADIGTTILTAAKGLTGVPGFLIGKAVEYLKEVVCNGLECLVNGGNALDMVWDTQVKSLVEVFHDTVANPFLQQVVMLPAIITSYTHGYDLVGAYQEATGEKNFFIAVQQANKTVTDFVHDDMSLSSCWHLLGVMYDESLTRQTNIISQIPKIFNASSDVQAAFDSYAKTIYDSNKATWDWCDGIMNKWVLSDPVILQRNY